MATGLDTRFCEEVLESVNCIEDMTALAQSS